MVKIQTSKIHLLVKRAKIIKFLKEEGYDGSEIGEIFNIDRSTVSRILATERKYKGLVKKTLAD